MARTSTGGSVEQIALACNSLPGKTNAEVFSICRFFRGTSRPLDMPDGRSRPGMA